MIASIQRKIRLDASLLLPSYSEIDLQLTLNDNIIDVYIDENFQWFNHFLYVSKNFFLH